MFSLIVSVVLVFYILIAILTSVGLYEVMLYKLRGGE